MPPATTLSDSEPLIPYVPREDFDPSLEALVGPYVERMGFLPNALKIYAQRPAVAYTLFTLNNNVMRDESSTLPQLLKRKVAAICSAINGCRYCTAHSCALLKRAGTGDPLQNEGWLLGDDEVRDLVSEANEPANDQERVAYAYARAATRNPGNIPRSQLEELKQYLNPAQIVELACVVGFWKFYNTVHDSLHIPVESELADEGRYVDLATDKAYGRGGEDREA